MRTIFCVLATLMLGLAGMQAQSLKAIKLNAVLLRIMQNAAQHRDHDHHREYRFYRGMYKPHVLHRKARPCRARQ